MFGDRSFLALGEKKENILAKVDHAKFSTFTIVNEENFLKWKKAFDKELSKLIKIYLVYLIINTKSKEKCNLSILKNAS